MQNKVESDLVYFLHIPKTSGTSLHYSFLRVYGPEATSSFLWDDLVNGTYQLSERHRLITGHFGGFLPLWLRRWPRIVTMLRDPLARALSHINHVQREQVHPLHLLSAGLTVEQYCQHPVLRRTVDNFQSRYLASLDFALALMPRPPSPGPRALWERLRPLRECLVFARQGDGPARRGRPRPERDRRRRDLRGARHVAAGLRQGAGLGS